MIMGQQEILEKERTTERQKAPPPSRYQVIGLNDDFTSMEFVLDILISHFNKSAEAAGQIMLEIHNNGKGVCGGPYSKDAAETKIEAVHVLARREGHPFQLVCEPLPPV